MEMKKALLISMLCMMLPMFLFAESIEEKLQAFGKENGKEYIQPFCTALGTDLNTGLYGTAKTLGTLHFGITINTSFASVPSEDKTFTAKRPDIEDPLNPGEQIYLYNEPTVKSATCFGETGGTFTSTSDTGNDLILPDGANTPVVPFAMPQVSLGLPFGNEIMLRWLPQYEISSDIGKIGFFGIGLKHDIDQYIPLCPVSLAAQAVYQQMKLGDIVKIKDFALNAEVSKTFLMLTLYGGLQYEHTTLHAAYTIPEATYGDVTTPATKIAFDIDGDNSFRGTAGLRLRLLIFNINLDYSLSKYPVFNLGLGASI
jgi:hypothetical protein